MTESELAAIEEGIRKWNGLNTEDALALLAEVKRLRELLCPDCRCASDHRKPCYCQDDE